MEEWLAVDIDDCFPANEASNTSSEIDFLENCTYNTFFKNYMLPNRPCILKNVCQGWNAARKWKVDGEPNWEFWEQTYGDISAPVADCDKKYYNSQEKCDMKIKDFIKYWKEFKNHNYNSNEKCLYLKDWHYFKDCNASDYAVPIYFVSDWLNEYYMANPELDDDYRFVYMGPKTSWTPLHEDVFSSYSWSVNVCGRKRWILLPPGVEKDFMDNHGNLAYDINPEECERVLNIVQDTGDALFVPSGWYHQVWNLEDTISINHNWVNGCNIQAMWISLKKNLNLVKKEIADVKDMENWTEQCQLILKASYGIDFRQFYEFLHFIGKRRINCLESKTKFISNNYYNLSEKHLLFDLKQLLAILNQYLSDSDTINLNLNLSCSFMQPLDLQNAIIQCLDHYAECDK